MAKLVGSGSGSGSWALQRRANFLAVPLLLLAALLVLGLFSGQRDVYSLDIHRAAAGGSPAAASYAYILFTGNSSRLETRSCAAAAAVQPPRTSGSRATKGPQIVSATIFNNELDMLFIRMVEHYDVLDHFIVIESPVTFSGKEKPLHFSDALCTRFARFTPKVVHVVINGSEMPSDSPWSREHASRNALTAATVLLNLQPHDLILASDTDEIPTATAIQAAANQLQNHLAVGDIQAPVVTFDMQLYYYSLYHAAARWKFVSLFPYQLVSSGVCAFQDMRPKCQAAQVLAEISPSGVHISYAFAPENIALKIKSFSHTEYDKPEYTEVKEIKRRISIEHAPFDEAVLTPRDPNSDPELFWFSPEARKALIDHSTALRKIQQDETAEQVQGGIQTQ